VELPRFKPGTACGAASFPLRHVPVLLAQQIVWAESKVVKKYRSGGTAFPILLLGTGPQGIAIGFCFMGQLFRL